MSVAAPSIREIERQYRVLRQTLSMHTMLRDRYASLALFIDIVLLGCSVVFCATTFSADELLARLGLPPETVRDVLRIASVVAFLAALVSLRVDWKAKSSRHGDAAERLTKLLGLFRNRRNDDGAWPEDVRAEKLRTCERSRSARCWTRCPRAP